MAEPVKDTMRHAFAAFMLTASLSASAQWTWTPVTPLPMPTSNHALCAAEVNGSWYVYAFGGITSGLQESDIHRNAFHYDVAANSWSALPDVPDTLGKIASAASVVGDTAYVIGGYHVFSGSPYELSSNRVHRLDLTTNTWKPNGANIPVPIDDQVQAVWRDSLIYVITGWSNTTNVANVQVYDPAHDQWTAGTPVPNTALYKAFGASGVIIGDTIYYHGGASTGANFPAQDRLRIGVIDPLVPTSITWLPAVAGTLGARYRAGAIAVDGAPVWVGGSAVSYNYDAVAYNGSGIVQPATDILRWSQGAFSSFGTAPAMVMDLRGVGDIGGGSFVIAGGIGAQQAVLDSVWLVQYNATGIAEGRRRMLKVYPMPATERVVIPLPLKLRASTYTLNDAHGRLMASGNATTPVLELDVRSLPVGLYAIRIVQGGEAWVGRVAVASDR